MHIAIISENSQGGIIQSIQVFYLKFHKIYLNRLSQTIVLDIHYFVLIEFIYNIFVE